MLYKSISQAAFGLTEIVDSALQTRYAVHQIGGDARETTPWSETTMWTGGGAVYVAARGAAGTTAGVGTRVGDSRPQVFLDGDWSWSEFDRGNDRCGRIQVALT